jgi:nucleoside-diphosphate-sugar epimerase
MRLLVIGGSGDVGTLTIPYFREKYDVRVFDLKPPCTSDVEYVAGNVGDYAALEAATAGCDAVIYLALYDKKSDLWENIVTAAGHFDVNVKGVYHALAAARKAGVMHLVYASTMSLYDPLHGRHFPDEGVTPDSTSLYGFTKRLGEEVCLNACRQWGMTVNALRLCLPVDKEEWQRAMEREGASAIHTREDDVARAFLAALERQFGGFEAFMITGNPQQKIMNLSKAKRLLEWEPLAR